MGEIVAETDIYYVPIQANILFNSWFYQQLL